MVTPIVAQPTRESQLVQSILVVAISQFAVAAVQARQVIQLFLFHLAQFLFALSSVVESQQGLSVSELGRKCSCTKEPSEVSSLVEAVDRLVPVLEKLADDRMSGLGRAKKITPSGSSSSFTPSESPTIEPIQPAAMQAVPAGYTLALPLPGSPGSVFFEGKNVTDFLDR